MLRSHPGLADGGVTIRRKQDVLRQHCEEIGRPWSEIEKSIVTRLRPGERAEALAARCRSFGDLGLDHVVFLHPEIRTPDDVTLVGDAAAQLAA